MTRYLLDTGIAQDFINHRNGVRDRADLVRHHWAAVGIGAHRAPYNGEPKT